MKVAVCIDDNNGMMFNMRRQSRDRELIKDFVTSANGNKIFIKPFSEILFKEYEVSINENMMTVAEENDLCFLEDENINLYKEKINVLIIYKWNRKYPADFTFEMPEGFTLKESTDFKGSSHEKITKEVYVR